MWRFVGFACLTVAIAAVVAVGWIWQDMQQQLHQPLRLEATETLVVEPGTSLQALAAGLVARGWLEHPYYLRFHARRTGRGHQIQAGEYAVSPDTTPVQLLDQLIDGRVVQHTLTIVEGWSYRQLLSAIQTHERLKQTLSPVLADKPKELMATLGLEADHPEGQFFPDTYHFPNGTTDVEFLRRAHRQMQAILADEWQQRSADLPYDNAYEALIMASIIEKETGLPAERADIAGVFVRRLEKGMRLQTDPTVIYAMGQRYDGNIRRKDLKIDSPYNTYKNRGLPPTPIAMPGQEAIHAGLHPAAGSALYFVSRGDGSHYFSDTLKEHNRAVAKYQLGRDIKLNKE